MVTLPNATDSGSEHAVRRSQSVQRRFLILFTIAFVAFVAIATPIFWWYKYTDDQEALRAATDAFGADYDVFAGADGRIEVIHTAYLYGIDDTGRIRVIWPFGSEPDRIAADIIEFLNS